MGRLVRSSSVGGSADFVGRITALRRPPPLETKQAAVSTAAAAAAKPKAVIKEQPRRCIFEFSSPPREEKGKQWRENFLDECALCKKEISEDRDRYMYGYLAAYCSSECRDDQIALDEQVDPPSSGQLRIERNLLKIKFNQ